MAQQNVMKNPYGAPRAMVGDREEFQPVKLFAVSGRIGRARYIVYSILVSFVLVVPAMALMALSPGVGMALLAVAYIASFVMSIMLTIQRSHDFNMSGWFSLLMFVPLAALLFWFIPGTDGPNRFGAKTPPNSTGVTVALWIVPVVFVLGIAAAVALPAYQDYVKRAATVQTR
jgi:Predicted membrane protein